MRISDWSSDVCSSDLQCLAPTARSAGDIGPFGSLAISLFNDRETDIAGLLQRIAEPVVQCFAIEGKISIECQGRPGHLMPAVRAEYRVPTRQQNGRASCRDRGCQYGKI